MTKRTKVGISILATLAFTAVPPHTVMGSVGVTTGAACAGGGCEQSFGDDCFDLASFEVFLNQSCTDDRFCM